MPAIRGVIFDLDGTLVDSRLDFAAMRREIGLPDGTPLLEGLARLSGEARVRGEAVLTRHEWEGAQQATLMAGAGELLAMLAQRGMRLALVTRNRRDVTLATLARLGLEFEIVLTRDDAPPKPDPAAVATICRQWEFVPHEVAVVGDYVFDIEAGRRAGTRTVLYTRGRDPAALPFDATADLVVASLADVDALLAWFERPG
ncbi:MAG: HAD family hydrolase [Pirellulales bacterium]|nr:HAD family hydrolase [Pirellulales bacterium]